MSQTIEDKIKAFQTFMMDLFYEWSREKRIRNPTDTKFAQEVLGAPVSSYNHWVRGLRLPDTDNAYKMFDKLAETMGLEVAFKMLEILEIKPRVQLIDPDLRFIYAQWKRLPGSYKDEVLKLITQYQEGIKDNGDSAVKKKDEHGERAGIAS